MTEQKKTAALNALIVSNSLSEAAETAGIDRRTLYNYLHNDLQFARAYDEIRDRQAIAYFDDLLSRRERANAVIMDVLEDEGQPAAVRLKAAQMILDAVKDVDEKVSWITKQNINANKDMWDFSVR